VTCFMCATDPGYFEAPEHSPDTKLLDRGVESHGGPEGNCEPGPLFSGLAWLSPGFF